jgi:four helix bundle protein
VGAEYNELVFGINIKDQRQKIKNKNTMEVTGNGNSNRKTEFQGRTYRFALDVIQLIDSLPKERTAGAISDQLIRSATSIGANVVEAQASSSKKDYANFFGYALKSANETKFWLSLLRDAGKTSGEQVDPLIKEVSEVANVLGASLVTMRKK